MGGLAAFQDLAFGRTAPVTGLLANRFRYAVVSPVGGLAAGVGSALISAIATRDR